MKFFSLGRIYIFNWGIKFRIFLHPLWNFLEKCHPQRGITSSAYRKQNKSFFCDNKYCHLNNILPLSAHIHKITIPGWIPHLRQTNRQTNSVRISQLSPTQTKHREFDTKTAVLIFWQELHACNGGKWWGGGGAQLVWISDFRQAGSLFP